MARAVFADQALALKLETVEARNQVDFTRTHRSIISGSQADSARIGSGYAVFVEPDSPVTQAIGLGLKGKVHPGEVAELERFFFERAAPAHIEVSHLADPSLTRALMERGFRLVEHTTVLLRHLDAEAPSPACVHEIRRVRPDEVEAFSETVARGFLETDTLSQSYLDLFCVAFHQPGSTCFGAFAQGHPVGGAAVIVRDGVAAFGGASTLPEFRKQGIQTALLQTRLAYAREHGCRLAMVTTLPGSVSQWNALKQGFQLAYARTKLSKTADAKPH